MAVIIEREAHAALLIAAVAVRQERLAALGGPLDRPADPLRRPQHQRVLGIERVLAAETAAHIGRPLHDLLRRHVEHALGEVAAVRVDVLRRADQLVGVRPGVVAANRAARLHGRRRYALVVDRDLDHVRGAGERRVDGITVARLELDQGVAAMLRPDQLGASLERLLRRQAGRLFDVVDHDGLGGVGRLHAALRHHQRHCIADEARPPDAQPRAHRRVRRGTVEPLGGRPRGNAAEAVRLPVAARQDRDHARHLERVRRVDLGKGGVCMGRANDHRVRHAGQHDVVDVAARAGQEAPVLEASHRLTDPELLVQLVKAVALGHALWSPLQQVA